jgi:hypothetical protein
MKSSELTDGFAFAFAMALHCRPKVSTGPSETMVM